MEAGNASLSTEEEDNVKTTYFWLINGYANAGLSVPPPEAPKPNTVYSHYKKPELKYLVLGVGLNTEYMRNWENLPRLDEFNVVYIEMNGTPHLYCRSLTMWLKPALLNDGTTTPRFKFHGKFAKSFKELKEVSN